MATYRGAEFIAEQLESIAKQTRLPDELVVSDDCSPDSTVEIVGQFASRAPFPVHIHRNEQNLGFSRNFARALQETQGDLIFIADQDDIWLPQKIERVVAELDRSTGYLALIHDERILDQRTGKLFERTYFDNQRALNFSDRELVSGNCTALRRELLDILAPFPDGINYDYWIGWIADVLGCRIVLREPLQLYRRHGANASEPVMSERRPTQWSVLLRTGLPDPRPAWEETSRQYALIAGRIDERAELIDALLGTGRAEAAGEKLAHERSLLQRRIEMMSRPPFRRRIEVLRNWRRGFYNEFSGFKSAIRDLLQP